MRKRTISPGGAELLLEHWQAPEPVWYTAHYESALARASLRLRLDGGLPGGGL